MKEKTGTTYSPDQVLRWEVNEETAKKTETIKGPGDNGCKGNSDHDGIKDWEKKKTVERQGENNGEETERCIVKERQWLMDGGGGQRMNDSKSVKDGMNDTERLWDKFSVEKISIVRKAVNIV